MGKRQRLKKEKKEEIRLEKKEEITKRGKERFWALARPFMKKCIVLALAIGLFWGAKLIIDNYGNKKEKSKGEKMEIATINTDKGDIVIQFYKEDAPKTVENFILLAKRGYYDGTKFHRVEMGFVIQGGDPLSKDNDPSNDGTGGESAWGGKFADELNPNTPSYKKGYVSGTVAMANSGPNTNGSQFFIVLEDQTKLPMSYSIFGYVTGGMDVVKKISKGDVMNKVIITKGN